MHDFCLLRLLLPAHGSAESNPIPPQPKTSTSLWIHRRRIGAPYRTVRGGPVPIHVPACTAHRRRVLGCFCFFLGGITASPAVLEQGILMITSSQARPTADRCQCVIRAGVCR